MTFRTKTLLCFCLSYVVLGSSFDILHSFIFFNIFFTWYVYSCLTLVMCCFSFLFLFCFDVSDKHWTKQELKKSCALNVGFETCEFWGVLFVFVCLFVCLFSFSHSHWLFPDGGGGDSGGDDSNKKKGANYRAMYIAIPIVLLAALVTVLVLVYYRRSVHIRGGRRVSPLQGWEGVTG